MGLLSKFFSNARKPEGFLGKIMVNGMNGGGHAAMANWALAMVTIGRDDRILDIGCGGGANIARLLQRTLRGSVTGIDFSPVSVWKSTRVNTKAIREGRCRVLEGNVANLPFPEGSFDMVTAFETIYFWPDIEHCFNEVKRVLKPGGQFVIVNESDGRGEMDAKWESMIEGMHTYTPEEVRRHLTNVGFNDLNITVDEGKRWLCATARK
ncbi:MAG: class I SAM-dependent methyltransferase [Bacteroidales bacterium]|nr:class I SAM-dependent methyltransferase [Bacteroidales bacterium]